MRKINNRGISRFIIQYRNILIALGASIVVWNITSNPPSGQLVLISNQFIPAGTKLNPSYFSEVHINGFEKENLVGDIASTQNKTASSDLQAGTVMSQELISPSQVPNNRVDVFIALEQQIQINPGDKLHLWNVDESFSRLVSQDAVVRRSGANNYGTELVVSVPLVDEYQVMQSQNIQVTQVSN
jgi:hypothetical protein